MPVANSEQLAVPRRRGLAIALAGYSTAHAGTALYHLTPLTVPDATSVSVIDLNDAGQAVGTYTDNDFVRHAVLWDANGDWHELTLPGDGTSEVDGIARAINNEGEIVGTADDGVMYAWSLPPGSPALGTVDELTTRSDAKTTYDAFESTFSRHYSNGWSFLASATADVARPKNATPIHPTMDAPGPSRVAQKRAVPTMAHVRTSRPTSFVGDE